MRSEQVHKAIEKIPNRFSLCGTVSRATRVLHVGNMRTEDTMGGVLNGVGDGTYKEDVPLVRPVPSLPVVV